jgi:uncharacterized protein YjbJ (UPF0337 family)
MTGSVFIGQLHVESAQQAVPFQKVPEALWRQPERDAAIKNRKSRPLSDARHIIFAARNRRCAERVLDLLVHQEIGKTMSGTTDKIKGMANEAVGKAKQGIGEMTGSDKLKVEGAAQEAKGDAQQAMGDAKNAAKDAVDKTADTLKKPL